MTAEMLQVVGIFVAGLILLVWIEALRREGR